MPQYAFEKFLLDTESRVLSREGTPTPLTGKPLDTLLFLVQNHGRLITKDELLSSVWPDTVVEESSLSQSIFMIRKVLGENPNDRRFIATIAGRGYQFIAPVKDLSDETETKPIRPVPVAGDQRVSWLNRSVIALIVVASAAAAIGIADFWRGKASAPVERTERRLTFNSSANDVLSAAVSPDGKYLAYSDGSGIRVRLLSTGEERPVLPPVANVVDTSLYVDSWFPGGTELLVHSSGPGATGSVWALSTAGNSSRYLRDGARGYAVSPDGTRIAFSPLREGALGGEIWTMDNDGGSAQRIVALTPDEFTWSVCWAPDSKHLAYIRARRARQSLETSDLHGANSILTSAGDMQWVRSLCWLPDNRIVFSRAEKSDVDANLWQIRIDSHNFTARGEPERITRWSRYDVIGLSASADGKRVVLQKVTYPGQIYVARDRGGISRERMGVTHPELLISDEAHNFVSAWTADSKSILFSSDRSGKWGIYKQALGAKWAEALVEGRDLADLPRLSPDGDAVLYSETVAGAAGAPPRQKIMRVSVNGGVPRSIFELSGSRWEDQECSRAPAKSCVLIGPSNGDGIPVSSLDPVSGAQKLLRLIKVNPQSLFSFALAPDGVAVAMTQSGEANLRIQLLSLTGAKDEEINVQGWPNIESMVWSADGNGLYCGSSSPAGGTLFYVDRRGRTRTVWRSKDLGGGSFIAALPSPDGRNFALSGGVRNSNAWMIEGI